jgi:glutaredoxin
MNSFFTVYSLTDCNFCKKAINLLSDKKIPFIVVVMDKNPDFVTKIKDDMKMKTVPIIVHHLDVGEIKLIGGFDNLENYLNSPEYTNGTN